MARVLALVLMLAIFATTMAAQGALCCTGEGPARYPLVEIHGKIGEVRFAPGQRMPSIVVKSGNEDRTILLGPMRYLMAENFNPKVEDEVSVKAYQTPNGLIAKSVQMIVGGRTLRLRDDAGRPVWRGGRW